MRLNSNDIDWKDGMRFAIVERGVDKESAQTFGYENGFMTVGSAPAFICGIEKFNKKYFYIVERSEMFDHGKPCIKDADTLIKALKLCAEDAAKKDFSEHEKAELKVGTQSKLAAAIELVHNCATESLDPESMGNLEFALAAMAITRNIKIQIVGSVNHSNCSGTNGGHLDVDFLKKAEFAYGDKCIWRPNDREFTFIALHATNKKVAIVWAGGNDYRHCGLDMLVRPLTAEQKEANKLERDAKELCKLRCKSFNHRYNWDTLGEKKKEGYREMIRVGVRIP